MANSTPDPATPCAHANISQTPGSPYQYCEGCGAVRAQLSGKPGQFDAWHVCDSCRIGDAA